ncbi:hypothetical protein CHELA1G2_14698 [Hyphomicrobiales bacterium]|nr:hypothetical protein CHELA1G2_14698 [Hyphomicrobiales bacterium]
MACVRAIASPVNDLRRVVDDGKRPLAERKALSRACLPEEEVKPGCINSIKCLLDAILY